MLVAKKFFTEVLYCMTGVCKIYEKEKKVENEIEHRNEVTLGIVFCSQH